MRVVVILALGIRNHRITAGHGNSAGKEQGIVVNVGCALESILGEEFAVHLNADSIGLLRQLD